jgi:hypothetical protein
VRRGVEFRHQTPGTQAALDELGGDGGVANCLVSVGVGMKGGGMYSMPEIMRSYSAPQQTDWRPLAFSI